jgi:hypothetical protein
MASCAVSRDGKVAASFDQRQIISRCRRRDGARRRRPQRVEIHASEDQSAKIDQRNQQPRHARRPVGGRCGFHRVLQAEVLRSVPPPVSGKLGRQHPIVSARRLAALRAVTTTGAPMLSSSLVVANSQTPAAFVGLPNEFQGERN